MVYLSRWSTHQIYDSWILLIYKLHATFKITYFIVKLFEIWKSIFLQSALSVIIANLNGVYLRRADLIETMTDEFIFKNIWELGFNKQWSMQNTLSWEIMEEIWGFILS